MKLLRFPDSDGIVVELSDAPYHHSETLDEDRVIRYSADGVAIAIEFLGVSNGVNLTAVPQRDAVASFLSSQAVPLADRSEA